MSASQTSYYIASSDVERLRAAKQIIAAEAKSLTQVADGLGVEFSAAVDMVLASRGLIIVTGIGKAGLIGRKIAATLSSTGTKAQFLHPAEAVHGDLGCLDSDDVVLALSKSGETEEMLRLIPFLKQNGNTMIAITGGNTSTLGQAADVTLALGPVGEVGELQLAPSSSTTAMLALGDALALVVSEARGFTREDFARYHPGGNLGLRLKTVRETMRQGAQLRIAQQTQSIRDILVGFSHPDRRTGAVMLVDETGRLSGLFTDSDLARLLERRADEQLDRPIAEVMTCTPISIDETALLMDAVALLSQRRISELPVIDNKHQPVGLIDITDVISLMPDAVSHDLNREEQLPVAS